MNNTLQYKLDWNEMDYSDVTSTRQGDGSLDTLDIFMALVKPGGK